MSKSSPLPILLGGYSGVGKSTLGLHLGERGWLFLEADLHGADGIDALNLRQEWDRLWKGVDPVPLATELERRRIATGNRRVALGLPSTPLTPRHLASSGGVLNIQFLTGSADACLHSFLSREEGWATEIFWIQNNDGLTEAMKTPEYASHQIEAIYADGNRVPDDILFTRLEELA